MHSWLLGAKGIWRKTSVGYKAETVLDVQSGGGVMVFLLH